MTVFFSMLLRVAILIIAYMTVWFVVSIAAKRNDVADVAWGLGFIAISAFLVISQEHKTVHLFVAAILVTIWGLRLAVHVYTRNRGKKEDYRYEKWRQEWGTYFYLRTYLQVFLLQGFFMLLISAPLIFIQTYDRGKSLDVFNYVGIIVWMVGFFFEAVGDYQLSQFLKHPENKGKIMQDGLWSLSRHPNYFGEVAQWWGIFLIAMSVPHSTWSIIGPLTITTLILKVSGIPLLEKKYVGRLDFEDYKKKVSIFFPLPPRRVG